MRGWMIYCREDAEKNQTYIQWFQEEGEALGIEMQLKLVEDFILENGEADLDRRENRQSPLPDFALNRSRNAEIAKKLERLGVRCVNSAEVTRIANDKEETYRFFQELGIPMLLTRGVFVDKNLPNQKLCGYPLVAKSVDGHGGSEVFWVEESADWKPVLERLWGKRIILQPPCKLPGRDLRIFVLGGQVIAAVLRESNGDFRANYSLGGRIRLVDLTIEEQHLVELICSRFPIEYGGIDLLFDAEDRFYLNEVEDAVGSRSLSRLTDLNIARMVLQYIQASHPSDRM